MRSGIKDVSLAGQARSSPNASLATRLTYSLKAVASVKAAMDPLRSPVRTTIMAITIITGGQTGVDQGALEAALLEGIAVAGFCPEDRRDEHGPIPERYAAHLHPVERGGNLARTILNVAQADGTLLFYWQDIQEGTADTLRACLDYRKPFLPIDASVTNHSAAATAALAFTLRHSIIILNVAGPRITDWAEGFGFTRDVMTQVLRNLRMPFNP
jgi:hypothetical protein